LGDLGKLLGGAATGWFGRVASEHGKRRVLRRGLYKEIAHNAAMINWMSSSGAPRDSESALQDLVKSMLRTSYLAEARATRSTFDELEESYTIEDVYKGFDWILDDVTSYPPGVVHARLRGALHRIRHHIEAGEISKRLLLQMAPPVHRDALKKALDDLALEAKGPDTGAP
jgi:hypothetical protein